MAQTKKAAPSKPGKALVKPAAKGSIATMPDAMMSRYTQHAGAGLENATAQDYALPFLYLLQSNSPQVDEDNERYVEGAEAGMFINTVTNELITKLRIVPSQFDKVYNEWIPRDDGGGFVASYHNKQEALKQMDEDHQLVDTANHYVLYESEDETWKQAILSLTSTKLKSSRKLMSRIAEVLIDVPGRGKVSAPSFARMYDVTSFKTKNDKGTFFTTEIEPVEGEDGWTIPEVFDQAADFKAQVDAGLLGADFSKAPGTETVDAEEEEDEGEAVDRRGRRGK